MARTEKRRQMPLEDESILDLYWAREERAIGETDFKYGAFLYRIAYNYLHDRADSEECQNDTYLGIWNSIPPSRPEVFPAYIARIMRNTAIKRYKERTRKMRVPSEMTVSIEELEGVMQGGGTPEEEYTAAELGRLINDYLGTLTDRQQYIFIGRFYMSDTLETIAAELNVNASTVHRELTRIKQDLRTYLERNGVYV